MDIKFISLIVLFIVSYFSPYFALSTDVVALPYIFLGVAAFLVGGVLAKKIQGTKELVTTILAINIFTIVFVHIAVLPSGSIGLLSIIIYAVLLFIPMSLGLLIVHAKSFLVMLKKNWPLLLGVFVVCVGLVFLWTKTDLLVFGDQYDKQVHNCLIQNKDINEQHSCIMDVAREVYKFDEERAVSICSEKSPIGQLNPGFIFPGVVESVCRSEIETQNKPEEIQISVSKQRDLQRRRELSWLASRITNYVNQTGSYPKEGVTIRSNDPENYHDFQELLSNGLGDTEVVWLSIDPLHPDRYYQYNSDGQSFSLSGALENEYPDCSLIDLTICILEIKKEISTSTSANGDIQWNRYSNDKYGFSFMYPEQIVAYDAIDNTGGQIPDIAGFGYTKPGEYNPGNPAPANKQGSARILVFENISQDLRSFAEADAAPNSNWEEEIINGKQAFVVYSKDNVAGDRTSMINKTYYIEQGNTIYQIMGFSIFNEYAIHWMVLFDQIVQTFKSER